MVNLTQSVPVVFTAGSFASGASWITNYTVTQSGIHYLTIEVATACVPQMTVDGTNFYALNGGASINSGAFYTIPVSLRAGDTLNFNQASGGAITVNYLRVDF